MAINFPSSPSLNDEHTDGNGVVWLCIDATVGDVRWARKTNSATYATETYAADEAIAFAIALGG